MFAGTEENVLNRKRLFSAYRDVFEKVIFERKEDVTNLITRAIGSGPEVTAPTSEYYDGLLSLIIENKGNIYGEEFRNGYVGLVKRITNIKPTLPMFHESKGRTFSSGQKNSKVLEMVIMSAPPCGICQGLIDLQDDVQHDHILEYSQGGKTVDDNQRIVHPFCNNNTNRHEIERIRSGISILRLPHFQTYQDNLLKQLSFFDYDPDYYR